MNESVAKEIMGRYSHNSTMALNNPRRGGGLILHHGAHILKNIATQKLKKCLRKKLHKGKVWAIKMVQPL